jgi:hypothetical protein
MGDNEYSVAVIRIIGLGIEVMKQWFGVWAALSISNCFLIHASIFRRYLN